MKRTLLILAFACLTLGAWSQENNNTPFVEVRGNAEKYVEPNKIEVAVMLSELPSKGKITLAELDRQFADALKNAGIDIKTAVKITGQSSSAAKKTSSYQFKDYNVTVTNAQELAALFDALETNGIQDASVQRVWNTDQQKIMVELKIEAMKNAQSLAQTLAAAVNQIAGKAIRISDMSYVQPGFDNAMFARKAMATSNNMPSADISMVEASYQKILLQQNVIVRFELK